MSILDKVTSLLPRHQEREQPRFLQQERRAPRAGPRAQPDVLALRDDLDRWLSQFFEGLPAATPPGAFAPSVDVQETPDEVVVTIEVPGVRPDEFELMLTPEGLVIRGEKREEREDRRRDAWVTERRYGSFVRTVPLRPGLDLDRAEARIEHGVLTVRFPKATGRASARSVPIQT